ncbi:hypothetical protein QO001_005683 [Methylobacterium brachiatum]|uniref:Uncharacterized protein n=1 Tax=Methylobacterium brachiatum TaxID=269660 RepID=A0AAJ1TTL9_9HYPH|nr:hypothetical protein [Methylobacterium brachiatum]
MRQGRLARIIVPDAGPASRRTVSKNLSTKHYIRDRKTTNRRCEQSLYESLSSQHS